MGERKGGTLAKDRAKKKGREDDFPAPVSGSPAALRRLAEAVVSG